MGVANIRVCFMNGSMIEHDGLGITYFSVDILTDMVACWYVEYLSRMSKLDYCFEPYKSKCHAIKKIKRYDMIGSIPHQKFCYYYFPTRGRAVIKLGDADKSPMYL